MQKLRPTLVALIAVFAAILASVSFAGSADAAKNYPANFTVTTANPSVQDFGDIVSFLVETPASDAAKAANLEGGMNAVIVPKTVYGLGLFRAPKGWNEVTGPVARNGNTATVNLRSGSAGRPTIATKIEFKYIGGNWKLASNSLCHGVKTVGLNIYCNV